MSASSLLFRALPATEQLLQLCSVTAFANQSSSLALRQLLGTIPRPLLRDLLNEFLDALRQDIKQQKITDANELTLEALTPAIYKFLLHKGHPHFRRVLNASGVVIHTNLGRSLLADTAVTAVQEACAHYSNLEFDLATGERGSRYSHVEKLLCKLTGAEAALVVNNNAAAVFITLDALCKAKEVIVSRGELVEIGGSFRIPEVMEKSGCRLKEVGATNRTHLKDYRNAVGAETAAVMKVHSSNYRIVGFTSAPERHELVALAREHGIAAIEDLGSGSFYSFAQLGIADLFAEPTVQHVVASGMDVVTFSGDKVLGGPQAGIIVGKKEYIERIKRNPLNRALRIDKMTLAALEATLRLYTDIELAKKHIPTLRMMLATQAELKPSALKLRRILEKYPGLAGKTSVVSGVSRVGGGSFPECDLPTYLVAVQVDAPDTLRKLLLSTSPPLVGRIEHNAFCLDVRTLHEDEFGLAAKSLTEAFLQLEG